MERLRLVPNRTGQVADRIVERLARGAVVAPVLGGACVLSHDPGWLVRRFGNAFRLVADAGEAERLLSDARGPYRDKLARVLGLGAAVVLDGPAGWHGVIVPDGLGRLVAGRVPRPVGLGVPEEGAGAEELSLESGEELALVVEGDDGPGPTGVDFRSRPAVVDRRGALAILELERELEEHVRLGPDIVFSVLVVCTGNSCRSPIAAGLLAKMLAGGRAFVYSAGTDAPVGSPATRFAVEAAAELGVDISAHRSQQLDAGLVRSADTVLVMEEYHRQRVVELVPEAAGRTRFVAERDVPDPVGRSLEFYRQTVEDMRPGLEQVVAEIRGRLRTDDGDLNHR